MTYLLVAVAGGAGAAARFALGAVLGPRAFPFATLTVNVLGSFGLGLVTALAVTHGRASDPVVVALTAGFFGAFTTFSTFSLETLRLLQSGRVAAAIGYVAASVALGLLAATLGYLLAAPLR